MAENNFSALVQLIVDKAQARSALQRELKELQREAQLEIDVKVNLSDVRQARNEIAKANREQQEGTRENIKLRAQELAHARMVAKETKVATDLEIANRQREMKLSNQAMSEELANRKRITQEQKVATQEELASRESIRKLNEQTFKEESSARKQAMAETKLQAQEQRALQSSLNAPENRINRKLDNDVYSTNIDKLKQKFQDYGLTVEQAEAKVKTLRDTLKDMKGLSGDELIKKANELDTAFEKVKVQLDQTKLAYDQLEQVNKIQLSIDDKSYEADIAKITKSFTALSGDVNEAKTHVQALQTAYEQMVNATDDNARLQAEKNYQQVLARTRNELVIAQSEAKEYVDTFKVQKLRNDIQDWLKKNTAATHEAKDAMQSYLRMLDGDKVSPIDFNTAKSGFDDWDTAMRQAGKLGKSLTETFKEGAKSFASWTVSSGAVMEVWQGLKRVYDEALKLDGVMTDLAMATDLTASQMESVVDKWSDLGEDLNATTSDMIASGTEWIKQGQSIADTEKLITSAMVLDKVGKLENAQATEYLTSAMKGYKVAVEDTMDIVDKLSAVDMASATDVGGLAEAMSQVANNANLAGVSMDKLLGYIAVIGETTGEGMSSVGTGLNAIFSRMGNIKLARLKDYQNNGEDLSNVETVLRGEGIVLRDSANEFRNFGEVLDEVAGRWTSFSEVSQRAIASAFAGTNHMEQFMVLMEGYGKATEYTEKSLNSSGEAMQKFEDYQKSVTAHTELFNKSIQDLANTAIDSGLVNFFIDCGTGLVKFLDGTMNLLTPLGTLGVTLGGILGVKNAGICV